MFTRSLFPFFLLLASQITYASAARDQFTHWYPEFGFIFERIVHENCSSEYGFYLHGQKNRTHWYDHSRWIGSGSESELVTPLVDCILKSSPEYIKSNMASATVLLGLAPAILATLGSNFDESSVLAVVGERPILAFFVTAGSPAMIDLRAFEYRNPLETLDDRAGRFHPLFFSAFSLKIECFIIIVEYIMIFAAIANVATVCYQLSQSVVLTFAPHVTYIIILWCFFTPFTHILAAIALRLRVSRKPIDRLPQERLEEEGGHRSHHCHHNPSFRNRVRDFIIGFTPDHRPAKVRLKPETPLYLLIFYSLSVLTTAHVMVGVLVFSSMLFISVRDGLMVLIRLMASVMACRMVLMYELAKLRHLYNMRDEDVVGGSGRGSYHLTSSSRAK